LVRESLGRESGGGTAVAPVAEDEAVVGEERTIAQAGNAGPQRTGGSAALASAYDVVMGGGETDDMPTSIAPVPANLDKAGVEWYVAIDGAQQGPFAFAELVRRIGTKEVQGRHYVWHDGMDNWTRCRDAAELQPYFPQKKKPPPPPLSSGPAPAPKGDGAEVVDFASRRAERQKNLGASVVEPIAAHETAATALDSPTAPGTSSERAEQLDKVLNEALGIQNEGKTAKAEPQKAGGGLGVAGLPAAPKEGTPSIDDLLAFDHHGEDIFANVPRATDEVQRESTRFFVAAAGVNRQRSRNKMGIVAGAVAALAIASFFGAWATGMIAISIPGIGNPFHNPNAKAEAEEEAELSDEDLKQFEGLDGEKRAKAIKAAKSRKKGTRIAQNGNGPSPSGDYVTDDPREGGSSGSRGVGENAPIGIEINPNAPGGGASLPDSPLPPSNIDNVVDRGTPLSPQDLQKVIMGKIKSVSICYEQSLRGTDTLRGKLEIMVTVEPSGMVSKATVETSQFKGSKLGECIVQKIKGWVFPKSTGEAQSVLVPFILERGSSF
jgi:hypothetical protein